MRVKEYRFYYSEPCLFIYTAYFVNIELKKPTLFYPYFLIKPLVALEIIKRFHTIIALI